MVLPFLAPLLPYASVLLPFVLSNVTQLLQSNNNHANEMEKIQAVKELENKKAKQEHIRLHSRKVAIETAMETNKHNEVFMNALINEHDQISRLLEIPSPNWDIVEILQLFAALVSIYFHYKMYKAVEKEIEITKTH